MAARIINHVSVRALDLERSVRFYETLFGATRIATPYFGGALQWMKLGEAQLHIFQRGEGWDRDAHFAVEVDDFVEVYQKAKALDAFDTKGNWNHHVFEIPSGEVQLYLRDPANNLVEVVWPDSGSLPEDIAKDVERRADRYPQTDDGRKASFFA